ncbi:MAG: hypothetical protein WBR18_10540 [Anaerolineales bacterium]
MRRWLLGTALTIVFGLLMAGPGAAEGPGTGGRRVMLDSADAGPYLLRVVTSPTPPRIENLYLEIRVIDASSGQVVTDADVSARATFTDGEATPVGGVATHGIAPIPTEYAVHLPVERAGVWRIEVTVDGVQGTGGIEFLVGVGGSTTLGTALAIGLPVAGLALLVAVFLWLQRNADQLS